MLKVEGENVTISGMDKVCIDEFIRLIVGFVKIFKKQNISDESIEQFLIGCIVAAFKEFEDAKKK